MTRKQRLKNEAWRRTGERLDRELARPLAPYWVPGQIPPKPYPFPALESRKG